MESIYDEEIESIEKMIKYTHLYKICYKQYLKSLGDLQDMKNSLKNPILDGLSSKYFDIPQKISIEEFAKTASEDIKTTLENRMKRLDPKQKKIYLKYGYNRLANDVNIHTQFMKVSKMACILKIIGANIYKNISSLDDKQVNTYSNDLKPEYGCYRDFIEKYYELGFIDLILGCENLVGDLNITDIVDDNINVEERLKEFMGDYFKEDKDTLSTLYESSILEYTLDEFAPYVDSDDLGFYRDDLCNDLKKMVELKGDLELKEDLELNEEDLIELVEATFSVSTQFP